MEHVLSTCPAMGPQLQPASALHTPWSPSLHTSMLKPVSLPAVLQASADR